MFQYDLPTSGRVIYDLSIGYFERPEQLTAYTTRCPGLQIELLAYDNYDPGNLPRGALYCDHSVMADAKSANAIMFKLNLSSVVHGWQAGWRCSGLEVLLDDLRFYFVHDDDRPTPAYPTARGIIGLKPESYNHVRFLVRHPSGPLENQLLGCGDARLIGALVGGQVGLPEEKRITVIDFWNANISEVFRATQPEDFNLRARVTEFINGRPRRRLEAYPDRRVVVTEY